MVLSTPPSSSRPLQQFNFQRDMEPDESSSCLHSISRYHCSPEKQRFDDPQHHRQSPVIDSFFSETREDLEQREEYPSIANENLLQPVLLSTMPLSDTNKRIRVHESTLAYPSTVTFIPSHDVSMHVNDEVQRLWDEEEARLAQKEDDPGKESTLPSTDKQSKVRRGSKKIQKWKQRLRDKQTQRALAHQQQQHQSNENICINVINDPNTLTQGNLKEGPSPRKKERITNVQQLRLPSRKAVSSSPPTTILIDVPTDKNITYYPSKIRQTESKPTSFVLVPADHELTWPADHPVSSDNHQFFISSICDMAKTKPMRISGPTVLDENNTLMSQNESGRHEPLELDMMDTSNTAFMAQGDSSSSALVQCTEKKPVTNTDSCPGSEPLSSPYLDDNDEEKQNCECKPSCTIM
jgi:hypothetical protein